MSNKPATPEGGKKSSTYAIVLRGHLDARWADRLGVQGLVLGEDGTTSLRCVVPDQSALHGLLQRVRDLGLPLISVTCLDGAETRTS